MPSPTEQLARDFFPDEISYKVKRVGKKLNRLFLCVICRQESRTNSRVTSPFECPVALQFSVLLFSLFRFLARRTTITPSCTYYTVSILLATLKKRRITGESPRHTDFFLRWSYPKPHSAILSAWQKGTMRNPRDTGGTRLSSPDKRTNYRDELFPRGR